MTDIPKIAFDWEGVLGFNGHAVLRQMAGTLKSAGWEVVIISAVPKEWEGNKIRENEIEASAPGFPYYMVFAEGHEDSGRQKSDIMKKLGIEFLIDDTDEVCKAAVENGVKVLHVTWKK